MSMGAAFPMGKWGETFLKIIDHALEAVDPYRLIREHVRLEGDLLRVGGKTAPRRGGPIIDLGGIDKIHVLGAGKGAVSLFNGLESVPGLRIHGGIIVSVKEHAFSHPPVTFYPGEHPVPGPPSLAAGEAVSDYAENEVGENDLVIFLLTGGASALMVLPHPPLELADKIGINRLLLASGAGIDEINCVRKHLSALKGGRLAEKISPAPVISLILSDIIDSPLEDIGSGPSVGDSTSFADARGILEKYGLVEKVGTRVLDFLERGVGGGVADTPFPGAEKFSRNLHFLLGDNLTALTAGRESAEALGIPVHILTSADRGEAVEAAKVYAAMVKEIVRSGNPFQPPVLLLSGGELTVTLKGKGRGGRNQEFVLAVLDELKDVNRPFHIVSMGTDGIDGPTDAAGAWIDHRTMAKVKEQGLDIKSFLRNNNSYEFFNRIDQLIKTGPTGTNVMDLRMFYIPG